ncbi:TetR family transcriptional regulator [Phytoactinopolyspora alkaliphila]|uniref:TetR family transcriptional regulator n=1 Tax=Phytoactinopolyspora alkaliphila TaxID=1783498 RepID=A0A6N9YU07_9ACTN|nr:TetR family transcriptional regulator [Phytoactinopolyspora alkaliphila]NED98420.1 TetR family transcriptional regulator [Phytoactinopolyspora alkaliphila]
MARAAGTAHGDLVPDPSIQDGRRRKGEKRRRLLREATMRVIEDSGVAAVTQRAVAREAGLPPSAVMYYFPSVEEMLVAALTACNDSYLEELDKLCSMDDASALEGLASLIAGSTTTTRAHIVAEYELFLKAARRPEMRPQIARWMDALDALMARYIDDPVERAGATAAIDGLFLRACIGENPPDAGVVLHVLQSLIRRAG